MRPIVLATLFIIFGLQTGIFAQEFPELTFPYQSIEYTAQYSNSQVTDILIDSTGYLYIGTKEGLLIWDGNRFRSIENNAADSASLINNDINAIIEGYQHNILIATGSGVDILNTATNTYDHQFTSGHKKANGFNEVKFFAKTGDNKIWLGNESMIGYLNATNTELLKLKTRDEFLQPDEYFVDVYEDGNNVWILTTNNLFHFNAETKVYTSVIQNLSLSGEISSFAVYGDVMYVLTDDGYFNIFNKNDFSVINKIDLGHKFSVYIAFPIIKVKDEIWVLSSAIPFNFVIRNNKEVFALKLKGESGGLFAKTTYVTADQSVYFGCLNNIKYIPSTKIESEAIPVNRKFVDYEKKLPKNIVVTDNTLWTTTRDFELYQLNLTTGQGEINFKIPEKLMALAMAPLYIQPINDTTILTGYANNTLPYGKLSNAFTVLNKLSYFYCYNPKTEAFSVLDFGSSFYNKQKGNYHYQSFYFINNSLYLTGNTTIEKYQFDNRALVSYHLQIDTAIYSTLFYRTYADNKGNIWLSSVSYTNAEGKSKKGCVVKYQVETKKTTVYSKSNNITPQFSSSATLDIKSDNAGNIYLLNRSGVYILPINTDSIYEYVEGDELPVNTYVSMEVDNQQRIWLGTSTNGMLIFDKPNNKWITLSTDMSLLSPELTMQASVKDSKGRLFFYTRAGINIFNPETINFNLSPSEVIISDIIIRGNSIIKNGLVNNGSNYTFNHTQNDIDIVFSCLNFDNPDKNTFAYRLAGVDDEWIYAQTRNYATYHNLAPGKYTFEVKAANNYGIWSTKLTQIQIVITPAFWQTIWFKLLCTLLVAGIIYWIYKLRLERALAVEKIRSRISRDLHDDLGSTLSSISILSGQVKNKLDKKPEEVAPLLDKINESSVRMNDSLQDLVWAVKPENDTMQELLARMEQFASGLFESKNIDYTFSGADAMASTKINPEFIRNIYLIFKEAVNNIAKYSSCKNATIIVSEKNKIFNMFITDDGIGFNPETVKKGNGLNNMRKRAEQIGGRLEFISEPNKKTGIFVECKITS